MDYIKHLPLVQLGNTKYNYIFTVVDHLTIQAQIIPLFIGYTALTTRDIAQLFFNRIARLYGIL